MPDYNSFHSLATRNSIPFSQFLRLRRLCSNDETFHIKGKEMCSFFLSRNYPEQVINQAFLRVSNTPRHVSLQPSYKSSSNRPILVIPFHPHNIPVKKIVNQNWNILSRDPGIGHSFKERPMVAYKRRPNLRDHLVHSKFHTQRLPGTLPCSKPQCLVCPFLDNERSVKGPLHTFTVSRQFGCHTSNVVYAIRCIRCGMLYIGETGKAFSIRLTQHLADVRLKRDNRQVAVHFNNNGHSMNDLRAQIIWGVRGDLVDRRNLETWLIDYLGTITPLGLNKKM